MQKPNESPAAASTTVEGVLSPASGSSTHNVEARRKQVKVQGPETGPEVHKQSGARNPRERAGSRRPSADSNHSIIGTALSRLSSHLEPAKVLPPSPTLRKSLYHILTVSPLNFLLPCIPASWASHIVKLPDAFSFTFAFLAIIPLANLLAFATDEFALRVDQTLAGLLNTTLGNAVELTLAIIALSKCELRLVQSTLVGSILNNLLLVLGACFFAGGLHFFEQDFSLSIAGINSSLLTLSVVAVLIPAAFHFAAGSNNSSSSPGQLISDSKEDSDILRVSHGVAVVLLFIYLLYLVFQLFSHKSLYEYKEDSEDSQVTKKYKNHSSLHRMLCWKLSRASGINENPDLEGGFKKGDPGVQHPKLSVSVAIALLTTVMALVTVTAEFLVDSISGLTSSGQISQEFVGIILLPIVGNVAQHITEHFTAVTHSVENRVTLSIGVAVGSSIQIALFVIPFVIILGWIMGKPLDLLFDPLESIVLFFAVLTVNHATQDGRSNWLEGMILICLYAICTITFWYYPSSTQSIICT